MFWGVASCAGDDGGGGEDDTSTDTGLDTADTGGDTGDAPVDTAGDEGAGETGCASDGDCDESDPCTQDSCDLDYGTWSHDPVDEDGDGYPAAEVGGSACTGGTDCDDAAHFSHHGQRPLRRR